MKLTRPGSGWQSHATPIRSAYLDAAAAVAVLLRDPAVTAAWNAPSALDRLDVSALAGHLARQVTHVPRLLAGDPPPGDPPIALLNHYARARWIGADLDDEVNVSIRRDGRTEAAGGAAVLATRVEAAAEDLRHVLPAEPADRTVYLPWGPWSLWLDDFLVTRMLEVAVHRDDLAVSVGVAVPPLPESTFQPVLDLLSRLAVRRHGPTAVLRALSRAERSPATIAAF